MNFQPVGSMPNLTTKETRRLRDKYPSIEHLEAGHAASWLQERHDQLLCKAQRSRAEMNLSKLVTLSGTVVGLVCYATSPVATIGAIVSGIGYIWALALDLNDSHRFAPIPFVRDNFFDFLSAMGDAEAREEWIAQKNEIADLMFHLELLERFEFAMLREMHSILSEYLDQVHPGKRFYAYRWLCDRFVDFHGAIPDKESLNRHLQTVTPDPRINYQSVQAIQEQRPQILQQLPQARTVSLPETRTINTSNDNIQTQLPQAPNPLQSETNIQPQPVPQVTQLQQSPQTAVPPQSNQPNKMPDLETILKLPITPRAEFIVNRLIDSGFKIDEVMLGQVIAIAGSQRGGKGTLAAILTVLSKAYDPTLSIEYFTTGVDVYPFTCRLHSALSYPEEKDIQQANRRVAGDLLKFLKDLENSPPYSHNNLVVVIDEAMRLLSLMEESDRAWAIQFLLSQIAKTGATLIIVLHAFNLSSIAGKETAGLADTFKDTVKFVGCSAVAVDAGGLRKINIASGTYFQANPKNFGTAIEGGHLGNIPEWLKSEKHPGNGHPDPARTLLKFFPELVQNHGDLPKVQEAGMPAKFTTFQANQTVACSIINDLKNNRGYDQDQIISILWQVEPSSEDWSQALKEYEFLTSQDSGINQDVQ
ncbi:hypothetical protein [Nostoc linckia]|uniref:hypothetical protein n=1 Tax=Nostoc linckia TaxID=92942 RepID=UPI000BFFAC42|nr:hypothetical protein [Nostoc linckia]